MRGGTLFCPSVSEFFEIFHHFSSLKISDCAPYPHNMGFVNFLVYIFHITRKAGSASKKERRRENRFSYFYARMKKVFFSSFLSFRWMNGRCRDPSRFKLHIQSYCGMCLELQTLISHVLTVDIFLNRSSSKRKQGVVVELFFITHSSHSAHIG